MATTTPTNPHLPPGAVMSASLTGAGTRVPLHRLTYVPEEDGVMVGRPDTGAYGVFPREGADLLRSLAAGGTLEAGVERWQGETGQALDVADFLEVLSDLGFLADADQATGDPPPVRWQRLAHAVFSVPAWVVYAAVALGGLVTMAADPALRPSYRNLFFTTHISVIPAALALAQFPLMLLHEGYHALAGRRLGLPSRLSVGRRYYYLVAETRLDSLYSVPRSRRYLPFLAGALVDAVGVGALTMLSAAVGWWGAPAWMGRFALALALTGVLRIAWQCQFYLETDFSYIISTAGGCTDLHGAARYRVRAWFAAVRRRPVQSADQDWSPRDLATARWYAPLMVAGYAFSTGLLIFVGLPTTLRFWSTVADRVGDPHRTATSIADVLFFVLLSLGQFGLFGYVTIRDLRRRRAGRSRAITGSPS